MKSRISKRSNKSNMNFPCIMENAFIVALFIDRVSAVVLNQLHRDGLPVGTKITVSHLENFSIFEGSIEICNE